MAVIICTEKWPLPITYIGLYGTKILNEEVLLICSTVAASCSQPVFTQPLYCLSFNSTATRHTPVGFLPLSRFSRPSNGLFHRNLLVLNQDYRQFLSIWIYLPRQYKRDSSPVEYHHIARIALYWKHFFRYFPYLSSSCNSSVNK